MISLPSSSFLVVAFFVKVVANFVFFFVAAVARRCRRSRRSEVGLAAAIASSCSAACGTRPTVACCKEEDVLVLL